MHRFRAFLLREKEMRNELSRETSWHVIHARVGRQPAHRKSMGNRKYVMSSLSSRFVGETSKTRGIARAFEPWIAKVSAKMLKLRIVTFNMDLNMIDSSLICSANVTKSYVNLFCSNIYQSIMQYLKLIIRKQLQSKIVYFLIFLN